jgi:hypothetical protein
MRSFEMLMVVVEIRGIGGGNREEQGPVYGETDDGTR